MSDATSADDDSDTSEGDETSSMKSENNIMAPKKVEELDKTVLTSKEVDDGNGLEVIDLLAGSQELENVLNKIDSKTVETKTDDIHNSFSFVVQKNKVKNEDKNLQIPQQKTIPQKNSETIDIKKILDTIKKDGSSEGSLKGGVGDGGEEEGDEAEEESATSLEVYGEGFSREDNLQSNDANSTLNVLELNDVKKEGE
jgi:hypothetical protein